ncbi:MAG: hypothetical protein ABIA93_02635 [Candidatus Woesearchaeota archaeon]
MPCLTREDYEGTARVLRQIRDDAFPTIERGDYGSAAMMLGTMLPVLRMFGREYYVRGVPGVRLLTITSRLPLLERALLESNERYILQNRDAIDAAISIVLFDLEGNEEE